MSAKTGPDGHHVIFDGAGIGDFCPETSLLENFERLNIDIPNLCRKGRCGCCKLLLVSGNIRHEKQSALCEEELEENIILACCAYSQSDIEIELY